MKRALSIVAGLLFVTAPALWGQNITNSAHDFSGETWNPGGEICIVCHTPHFGSTAVSAAPLWNHEVTSATFTTYSNTTTLNSVPAATPNALSLLCLSCHDGTVALENFGGATGGTTQMPDTSNVGGGTVGGGTADISEDHPVSFVFNDALATADGGLNAPSTTNSTLGSTIEADLLFGTADAATLECPSCHNVHDDTNGEFLRVANTSSAFCLVCHNK